MGPITYYLTTHIPFAEEMHFVIVLWQMDDQTDLETLSAVTRMPVLEIQRSMQEEALLFVSNQIKQCVSPLLSQKDAKAQRIQPLSCTCQPEIKEESEQLCSNLLQNR